MYTILGLGDLQVRQLYDVFTELDADDSGSVDIDEFFGGFSFTFQTPLIKRFFEACPQCVPCTRRF